MNNKKYRCRIYYKDRITNEIWYYKTKGTRVSRDKLELYLKEHNKNFLYSTYIDGEEIKDKEKLTEH